MKEKLFKIFSSNIKVRVSGKNINNFIRRLIVNKINIVKVIPISYKEMDLIINYNDLEVIYKYKTIYDIKITKYYGKLKVLRFIKMNIFIISFLILGFIIISILSNIIFSIEIIHSNSNIIKLIEEELDSYGIKKYSFIKSYDEIEKIESKILDGNKDKLEWLEIVRDGTKYVVRVEERIINSNVSDNRKYNIISKKNAIIKSIIAYSGEKVKSINSYVKKGDVIISSDITLPSNEKIPKSASGKVIGEVWYNVNVLYPYYYNEVVYTGRKKKVISFNINDKKISLFDFDKYKSFDKDSKYIFRSNFGLFSLSRDYLYETRVINDIYTYDTAKEKAINTAKEKLLDKYKDIVSIDKIIVVSEEDMNSKIGLSLFITCSEDITEYVEVVDNPLENVLE